MQNIIAFLDKAFKPFLIIGDGGGGGLGQLTRLFIVSVDKIRVNIHAVGVLGLPQGHTKRDDVNAIRLYEFRGQITSAVDCNDSFLNHGFRRSKGASFHRIKLIYYN